MRYEKVIRDAVHGDLHFTNHEVKIMNTRPFQRLRGLKQLGVSDLVYPSATHTRFNHLLGTCGVARRMIQAINAREPRAKILAEHEQLICLGAMLHDVLNLPFGHTIEDEFPIFPAGHAKHDSFENLRAFFEDTSQPIGQLLRDFDPKAGKTLAGLIAAKEPMPGIPPSPGAISPDELGDLAYGADIIGNTICADLLDYLARDMRHTGLRYEYDFDRIVQSFDVLDKRLVLVLQEDRIIRRGLLSEILKLLDIRYTLGERVYYHPTKVMASAMVARAIKSAMKAGVVSADDLVRLTDEALLHRIEYWREWTRGSAVDQGEASIAERLIEKLKRRQLYRPAWELSAGVAEEKEVLTNLVEQYWKDCEGRERAEDEIAAFHDLPRGSVLIFCPDNRMSVKEAQARVVWPQMPSGSKLYDVKDRRVKAQLQNMKEMHWWLWRMAVYLDDDRVAMTGEIHAMCEGKFVADTAIRRALREGRLAKKLMRRGYGEHLAAVLEMASRDTAGSKKLLLDDLSPEEEDQALERMIDDVRARASDPGGPPESVTGPENGDKASVESGSEPVLPGVEEKDRGAKARVERRQPGGQAAGRKNG